MFSFFENSANKPYLQPWPSLLQSITLTSFSLAQPAEVITCTEQRNWGQLGVKLEAETDFPSGLGYFPSTPSVSDTSQV